MCVCVWKRGIPPNGYFNGEDDDNRLELEVPHLQTNPFINPPRRGRHRTLSAPATECLRCGHADAASIEHPPLALKMNQKPAKLTNYGEFSSSPSSKGMWRIKYPILRHMQHPIVARGPSSSWMSGNGSRDAWSSQRVGMLIYVVVLITHSQFFHQVYSLNNLFWLGNEKVFTQTQQAPQAPPAPLALALPAAYVFHPGARGF